MSDKRGMFDDFRNIYKGKRNKKSKILFKTPNLK